MIAGPKACTSNCMERIFTVKGVLFDWYPTQGSLFNSSSRCVSPKKVCF